MATERKTAKLAAEIAREAARFLETESNRTALITVTRAELGAKNQTAQVFLSVLPPEAEEAAVAFANRRAGAFRKFLGQAARMRRLPVVSFELDQGEKNRQRIEELSQTR